MLDQDDVQAIFVERSPVTSDLQAQSILKRRKMHSSTERCTNLRAMSSSLTKTSAAMKIPRKMEARSEIMSGIRSDMKHNVHRTKMT